jgi:transcriptional regulator with XRE-family HTH domain
MSNTELREFLRASRARISPADAGLPDRGADVARPARRVPGLRREEVALLAGVSVDYYARLEQGRTRQVSSSVLDAVAGALQLNQTERDYFFALALAHTTRNRSATPPPRQWVRPQVWRVLTSFSGSPAFVIGGGMQLLAMNPLARALLFDIDAVPVRERNLARWVFLAPEARERSPEWEEVASELAAVLRVDAAANPDDRDLNELIGELTVKSTEFRSVWCEHRVYECISGTRRFTHPIVGPMQLDYQALDLPASGGQRIIVYTAPEGSRSEESLNLLTSWTMTPNPGAPRPAAEPSTALND